MVWMFSKLYSGFCRAVILCVCVMFLVASVSKKDVVYYRLHIEEAQDFVDEHCKETEFSEEDGIVIHDHECVMAKEALEQDRDVRELELVVKSLGRIQDTLAQQQKIESKQDKLRFRRFRRIFSQDLKSAEDFVESCITLGDRVALNGIECLAALEVVLESLEQNMTEFKEKLREENEYASKLRRHISGNKDEIDKLLDGRCKEVLSHPWYEYDVALQDIECNVALSERRRMRRAKTALNVKQEKALSKDVKYYRRNLVEAKMLLEQCADDANVMGCAFARQAIEEREEVVRKRVEYENYFGGDVAEAKKVVDDCSVGVEKDELKCGVALRVFNKSISVERDEAKLRKYVRHFHANPDDARRLLKGRCSTGIGVGTDESMDKDDKCLAVHEVLKEEIEFKNRDVLIRKLQEMQDSFIEDYEWDDDDHARYKALRGRFKLSIAEAEEYIVSCVTDANKRKLNYPACLAAVNASRDLLIASKERDLAKREREQKYKEYYRRYFKEDFDVVDQLLEGRCKVLFSDPWYGTDPESRDWECDAAVEEKRRRNKAIAAENKREVVVEVKNEDYFIRNEKVSRKLDEDCRNGVVEDLLHCRYAMEAVYFKRENDRKRAGLQEYYSKRLLAASYHLKWCKAAMVRFDAECEVVDEVVKNSVEKILDMEKQEEYVAYFKENVDEAKAIMLGKCSEKLEDSWYFLDTNMQTEECNAAYFVAR